MPIPSATLLSRALRLGGSSRLSARSFSCCPPLKAAPIQHVFRKAASNRDFEAALDRLEWHHQNGKLTQQQATLVWTTVAERWPIREGAPILLDPEEHYLVAPDNTVEVARDLARKHLANPDVALPSLAYINTTRPVLDMWAPNDPITLFLLLTAYAQFPRSADGEQARLIKEISDRILKHIQDESKWQPFEFNTIPPKAGDEDWGMVRPSISKRSRDGSEYLAFRVQDAKAIVKSMDTLLGLVKDRKAEIELDLLDWYADQPTQCSPRFHRSRLYSYLDAITNPVALIVPSSYGPTPAPIPTNLPLELLKVFLRPPLVQHPLDPILNLYTLRALQLCAASKLTTEAKKEEIKTLMDYRLEVLESNERGWNGNEYKESLKLPKGEGVRVRLVYAIQCMNALVKEGVLSKSQVQMWDVVFESEVSSSSTATSTGTKASRLLV